MESDTSDTLTNVAGGAAVGSVLGALGAVLERKLKSPNKLSIPRAKTTMPTVEPESAPKKKREKESADMLNDITLGHAAGAAGGAALSYNIAKRLFARKDKRQLDEALANKERELNSLLQHEQSLAAGISKSSMTLLKSAAERAAIASVLEKLATEAYESLEKQGLEDVPMSDVVDYMGNVLGIKDPNAWALALPALLAGSYAGYKTVSNNSANAQQAKAIKDSLVARLTDEKEKRIGPMPIQVSTEGAAKKPLRPGAASLVDPTQSRDVLDSL